MKKRLFYTQAVFNPFSWRWSYRVSFAFMIEACIWFGIPPVYSTHPLNRDSPESQELESCDHPRVHASKRKWPRDVGPVLAEPYLSLVMCPWLLGILTQFFKESALKTLPKGKCRADSLKRGLLVCFITWRLPQQKESESQTLRNH